MIMSKADHRRQLEDEQDPCRRPRSWSKSSSPWSRTRSCDVVVCVPFVDLCRGSCKAARGHQHRAWARRTCHWEKSRRLHRRDLRRYAQGDRAQSTSSSATASAVSILRETDETVNKKRAASPLDDGLTAILCVGEMPGAARAGRDRRAGCLSDREGRSGRRDRDEQVKHVVIAYEPVWAIGTGKTATAEQANEVMRRHPQGHRRPVRHGSRGRDHASSTAAP